MGNVVWTGRGWWPAASWLWWWIAIWLVFVPVAAAVLARTQPPPPAGQVVWNQQGPDQATVSAYVYRLYVDAGAVGQVLAGVTCGPPVAPDQSGFTCQAAVPSIAVGVHTFIVTSADVLGESPKQTCIVYPTSGLPSSPASGRVQ